MPKFFISYRRAESSAVAGRIHEHLVAKFGEKNVFKDVDDIPPGVDFRDEIQKSLAVCDVMLVIIGNEWVHDKRLGDPNDFVRIEVESALGSTSTMVIPVLVQNTSMPTVEALPSTLRDLAYLNAVVIRDDPDFRRDIERLIAQLKKSHPQRYLKTWQALIAAGLILAVAVVAIVILTGNGSSGTIAEESSVPSVSDSETQTASEGGDSALPVLFEEDFEGQISTQIEVEDGLWQIVTESNGNHAYRATGVNDDIFPAVYMGSPEWTDYIVELRVKPIEPGGTQIMVRSIDSDNTYALDFLRGDNEVGIVQYDNAEYVGLSFGNIVQNYDDWNTIRVEVIENRISAFVNDPPLSDAIDDSYAQGRIGLQVNPQSTTLFDDIYVWSYGE